MVSFTCNACGQTVKKSKVEKHYQTECRDCSVLSCLDCGKDFYGDEYASHTSCISEAEKYQGKLYKDSNRGQPPKGEKKQQAWLEKVKQAAASSPATNPRLARLLDRLQEYTNIPRKMKKFQNFVRNSLNVRDQKTLDEMWSVFNGIQACSDGTGADTDKTPETCMMEDSTIAVDDEVVEVDKVKKKKKKRHSEMDNSETMPSTADEESMVTVEEDILSSTKKHKKKKHHHIRECEDVTTNTNQLDIQLLSDSQPPVAVEESVSKKKKKSKKKSPEQEAQCISVEPDTVEDDHGTDNGVEVEDNINHWVSSITDSGAVKKKKKKDKHKHCEVTDDTAGTGMDDDESTTVCTDVPLKDSKKKSKSKKRDVDVDQVVMEDNEVTVVEQKKKRKRKASTEEVPVEKKTKVLQIVDDEIELPSVKKHKKKKLIE